MKIKTSVLNSVPDKKEEVNVAFSMRQDTNSKWSNVVANIDGEDYIILRFVNHGDEIRAVRCFSGDALRGDALRKVFSTETIGTSSRIMID